MVMFDLKFIDHENNKTEIVFDEKRGFGFDSFYSDEEEAYWFADEFIRNEFWFKRALKQAKQGMVIQHLMKNRRYKIITIKKTDEHEAYLLRKLD